ncbi:MAG: aspartate aminotransferase family protein [Armatimonadota bacterium]|nr:aspartate aminotransferase family protein [Armatimonadota bacterium]MDR7485250.1 aspartate aminotransferase family protein [Armatimonadota bacterium]MDR7534210.1 aspartate aminotransferase family protein [Armatimonadota bacterium]MDR7537125.1 aspartate aminotransferase family protein [Armatimonadota bacterium]
MKYDPTAFRTSRQWWERARQVLAGGVSSSIRLAELPHPLFFTRAQGAVVETVDGHRLIDYVCGYGPIILGHADARVTDPVAASLARGQAYGGQHVLEVEVAERIRAAVPTMETMRFSSSGSEAVHAAIRIARAATGRWGVVRFDGHYHGWLDTIHAEALEPGEAGGRARPASLGQPADALRHVTTLPWNDREALDAAARRLRGTLAAVVLEPILCNTGVIPPRPGFLEAVRSWCDREGAVLIFDEVITGFRVGPGGAQGLLGVRPDLSVFGKAIANGFPLSVVGGRRDLLESVAAGQVLHAGTFNGHVTTLVAARATLDVLAANGGAVYHELTTRGRALMQGLRDAAHAAGIPVLVQGPGPVFHLWITDLREVTDARVARAAGTEAYARFALAMLRHGVRLIPGGRWYLCAAHTDEHIAQTVAAARDAFAELAVAVAR